MEDLGYGYVYGAEEYALLGDEQGCETVEGAEMIKLLLEWWKGKPVVPKIDKQAAMEEILKWLKPRVNDYYAPFIAEAVLHEKLEAARLTLDEFRDFVRAKNRS